MASPPGDNSTAAASPPTQEATASPPAPSEKENPSPPPPPASSPPPPPTKDAAPPPQKNESPPSPPKNESPPPPKKDAPPPASQTPPEKPEQPYTPPAPNQGTTPGQPSTPQPPAAKPNEPKPQTPPSAKDPEPLRPPPLPKSSSPESSPASNPPTQGGSGPPSSSDNKSSESNNTALIVGTAVGVVALLVIAGLIIFCIINKSKKKQKKWPPGHMQYYGDPSHARKGNNYYDAGHNQNWYGPPTMEHNHKGPPHAPPGYMGTTPGGGWTTSPQVISSGEMSSNFSDPNNAANPASPAGMAFSKSTFTYDELAAATNGFAQANLLGQGGFGLVHKGVLANGTVVAVKSLKSGSGQGEREFQAEVDIISRVHHRHLVSLVGYCIAGGQRMLVYEFVPNKTLEYHLHGNSGITLEWSKRLTLAVGSAKGLAYLHEDCHPRIIHRDIKAANILLDNNFEAMVADFGLAKLTQDNFTHVSTRVMGTFGYLAPEYASSGKLTEKSDVFSFGVMLLELITGRRPVDTTNKYMEDSLVDWARPLLTRALADGDYDELIDPRLGNAYNKNEMKRMMACASSSVRHSAKRRPKMSQIVRALEGDVSLDDLDNVTRAANQDQGSSSDYNTRAYNEDLKKFRKMALESTGEGGADDTSTYGLNPSISSDGSREMK